MRKIYLSFIFMLCATFLSAQYTVTGTVYNDPDAGVINATATPFRLPKEPLTVILVESAGNTVRAVTSVINPATGGFSIAGVPPGTYYATLITPNANMLMGAPAPLPILETGWVRTGESLDLSGVTDGTIDGRTAIFTITNSSFSGIKFGIQQRPFAHGKVNNLLNKASATTVGLVVNTSAVLTENNNAVILSGTDSSGGTITNYTINMLPKYGNLYLNTTLVTSLADVQNLTPAMFATLGYRPTAAALSQDQDLFTYYVTDNGGAKSNNANYIIPFALLDADNDTVVNRNDLDDDNDGILDAAECNLMELGPLVTQYNAGAFSFIRPSDFGFTSNQHRIGLNLRQDMSAKFGYPANSGAIIIHLTNANTHPSANEFFVNDSTGATQWATSGTIGVFAVIEHGLDFFSYDTRSISILNGTPKHFVAGQQPVNPHQTNWTWGNDGFNFWIKNDTALANPLSQGILAIGLTDPEPKLFQIGSTANNRDEWATYFVRVLPECDYDRDGIPNRVDLDSDNDGCIDALEGGATFVYSNVSTTTGSVIVGTGSSASNSNLCSSSTCVNANGIPLIATASGQTPVNTYNAAVQSVVCTTVMPVTLTNFTAAKNNNAVLLKWTTETEINNKHFEVERSNDAISWNKIGKVLSGATNGNSSSRLHYQLVDVHPEKGQNFYRLKQVDIDSKTTYSNTRQVLFSDKSQILLSPNPAQVNLKVEGLAGNESIEVYDIAGKLVMKQRATASTKEFSISQLNNGTYQLIIWSNDGTKTTHRFVKFK